jgi:RNA polymerase sigma-70 factor (ECF subfamily)
LKSDYRLYGAKTVDSSETEFQKIYAAFQPKILRYMARMVGETEAEDLTQDVFVKISLAMQSFRGKASLSTWIYRIATNTALDKLRSPSFQRIIQNSTDEQSSDCEPAIEDRNVWTGEKAPHVERQIFRQEMNDCVRGFIDKLPEVYRIVLILGEFERLSNREISEILGVTPGTVKIRLHRARKRLREELKVNCDSYWVEDNEFVPELKQP